MFAKKFKNEGLLLKWLHVQVTTKHHSWWQYRQSNITCYELTATAHRCSLQLQVLPLIADHWPWNSDSSSLTGQSHLRCTSGVRLTICTLIAWFFSYLGGIGQSLYFTSSPGSGTYSPSMSEMCTNISSPEPFEVTKPWPFDRLNIFTFPCSTGFSNALADVDSVLVRLVTIGLGTCNLGLPPGDSGDRSDGLCFPAYLGSDKW